MVRLKAKERAFKTELQKINWSIDFWEKYLWMIEDRWILKNIWNIIKILTVNFPYWLWNNCMRSYLAHLTSLDL